MPLLFCLTFGWHFPCSRGFHDALMPVDFSQTIQPTSQLSSGYTLCISHCLTPPCLCCGPPVGLVGTVVTLCSAGVFSQGLRSRLGSIPPSSLPGPALGSWIHPFLTAVHSARWEVAKLLGWGRGMRFPSTRIQPGRALGCGYGLLISVSLKMLFFYLEKCFITKAATLARSLLEGVPRGQCDLGPEVGWRERSCS